MSDIVERLQNTSPYDHYDIVQGVITQAADEIEKLRCELITTFKALQQSNGVIVDQAKQLVELDEQLAAHQWQPIETAPKDGTGFIGYEPTTPTHHVIAVCIWQKGLDGEGPYMVNFCKEENQPLMATRWMPLPAKPEEVE